MKINLLVDSDKVMGGYLNIDPCAKDGEAKVKGIIHDLNEYVDDGEAEIIRAIDAIGYFAHVDSAVVADNWIRKLKHGGTIIIGGIDIIEVARAIANRTIDIDQANILLYGNQKHSWDFYKAGFTALQLVEYLESKGLKITKKRIHDFHFIVEAVRP